jgi:hypothetical protein
MPGGFKKSDELQSGGFKRRMPFSPTGFLLDGAATMFGKPLMGAYNGWRQAMGYDQDPNAAEGYVTTDSIGKTGWNMAELAATGSLASKAPAGALRSGVARPDAPPAALDMSQDARLARAREQGFDTSQVVYHGSPDFRGVREAGGFEPRSSGTSRMSDGEFEQTQRGIYVSPDKRLAASYADDNRAFDYQNAEPEIFEGYARLQNPLTIGAGGSKFSNVPISSVRAQIPEASRAKFDSLVKEYADPTNTGKLRTGDLEVIAQKMGHDGFTIRAVKDHYAGGGSPSQVTAVFDPSRIRSVDAAFDPAKINDPNLMSANNKNAAGAAAALDMSQDARLARAREQGFDTDQAYYRGSTDSSFHPAGGGELGFGTYLTKDPAQAKEYARHSFNGAYPDKASVSPVHVRGGMKAMDREDWVSLRGKHMDDIRAANNGEWDAKFVREAEAKIAKEIEGEGYGGFYTNNPTGEPSFMYDQGVVFDPANMRSPYAAFDPAKINDSNLMSANPFTSSAPVLMPGPEPDIDPNDPNLT